MTDPWFFTLDNCQRLADWLIDRGELAPSEYRSVEIFPRAFEGDWERFQQAKAAVA